MDDVNVKSSALIVSSSVVESRMFLVPLTLTLSNSSGRITIESGEAI